MRFFRRCGESVSFLIICCERTHVICFGNWVICRSFSEAIYIFGSIDKFHLSAPKWKQKRNNNNYKKNKQIIRNSALIISSYLCIFTAGVIVNIVLIRKSVWGAKLILLFIRCCSCPSICAIKNQKCNLIATDLKWKETKKNFSRKTQKQSKH